MTNQIISEITEEDKKEYTELIDKFYKTRDLSLIKDNPTLFCLAVLRNPNNPEEPLKPYVWQHIFLKDNSNRKLVCISRQTGKSIAICMDILLKAFKATKDITIMVVSASKVQAQDILYKIKNLMKHCAFDWSQSLNVENKSEIYIKNLDGTSETRVLSLTASDVVRGYSCHAVYLDEFSFIENAEHFFNSVVEPVTLHTKGDITVLSTPTSCASYFYELYKNNNWKRYKFDWSVCPAYTKQKIKQIEEDLNDPIAFRTEYLAEFVTESMSAYYPANLVRECIVEDLQQGLKEEGKNYYCGVDFGQMKSANVITVISHEKHKDINEVKVVEIITRHRTSYASIIGEIIALNEKYKFNRIFCDRGAGAGQIDVLKEKIGNIEGVNFTLQSKVDMNNNLRRLFEKKEIKLPNNKDLINELLSFEYEYTSNGTLKLRGSPDDHVDALALACMAVSNSTFIDSEFIKAEPNVAQDVDEMTRKGIQANEDFIKLVNQNMGGQMF